MGWFERLLTKSSPNMIGSATSFEKGKDGSYFYGANRMQALLSSNKNKVNIDMKNPVDKVLALQCCTPFASVVDKIGKMFSNSHIYIVDKDGNELSSQDKIRTLLSRPNPIQTRKTFLKEIEKNLTVFGYCPIFTVRATKKSLPKAMWCIPPELFHIEPTGKLFHQHDIKEIIKRVYVTWNGQDMDIQEDEYFLILNSNMIFGQSEVMFSHITDSLSVPISLWMSSMKASNTLISNGGPKGIIYNKTVDETGYSVMAPEEKEAIESEFKERYGLVDKLYSIFVTRQNVGWIPLDYDAGKLKLHEEDARCTDKICNAMGLNPNVFTDAKYDNQESAKKAAYQDLIMPDSEIVAESLTSALCEEGVFIKLDYSHVDCMQKDKASASSTIKSVSEAFVKLVSENLITRDEARKEIANYIDIDPDKPEGEYNNEQVQGENREKV